MAATPETDEVFARHVVAVAYLFGSRAEGTDHEGSDHDVAVLFGGEPTFDATVRLGADLAGTLGTPVDVIDGARAAPVLGRRAEASAVRGRGRGEEPLDRVPAGRRKAHRRLPSPRGDRGPALMVDTDRVRRLLVMLERHRRLLAEDQPDPFRRRHLVQTAAQICIDLAQHVIASDGHRVPQNYGDAFRVLVEAGVLDCDLGERMVSLAGARDLIVHLYAEIDDDRLARAVREGGLDDLDAFARRIAALTV